MALQQAVQFYMQRHVRYQLCSLLCLGAGSSDQNTNQAEMVRGPASSAVSLDLTSELPLFSETSSEPGSPFHALNWPFPEKHDMLASRSKEITPCAHCLEAVSCQTEEVKAPVETSRQWVLRLWILGQWNATLCQSAALWIPPSFLLLHFWVRSPFLNTSHQTTGAKLFFPMEIHGHLSCQVKQAPKPRLWGHGLPPPPFQQRKKYIPPRRTCCMLALFGSQRNPPSKGTKPALVSDTKAPFPRLYVSFPYHQKSTFWLEESEM